MTKRWYIIHAYSNFEKKVAEYVQERASLSGIEDLIEEIVGEIDEKLTKRL